MQLKVAYCKAHKYELTVRQLKCHKCLSRHCIHLLPYDDSPYFKGRAANKEYAKAYRRWLKGDTNKKPHKPQEVKVMNSVVVMGRLTRDPEVRESQSGSKVARYTIAVDRMQKDADGNRIADFIPCTAFGKAAEFAEQYLQKGTKIAVSGRLQSSSYEKDGKKSFRMDLIVATQEFAESRGNVAADQDDEPEGF